LLWLGWLSERLVNEKSENLVLSMVDSSLFTWLYSYYRNNMALEYGHEITWPTGWQMTLINMASFLEYLPFQSCSYPDVFSFNLLAFFP